MLTTPELTSDELEVLQYAAGDACKRYSEAELSQSVRDDMREAYKTVAAATEAGEERISVSQRGRQLLVYAVLDYSYSRNVRDMAIKVARKLNEAEER
jgi:hypothetical protein